MASLPIDEFLIQPGEEKIYDHPLHTKLSGVGANPYAAKSFILIACGHELPFRVTCDGGIYTVWVVGGNFLPLAEAKKHKRDAAELADFKRKTLPLILVFNLLLLVALPTLAYIRTDVIGAVFPGLGARPAVATLVTFVTVLVVCTIGTIWAWITRGKMK
jgi:uncharacterized membrane protein YqjE